MKTSVRMRVTALLLVSAGLAAAQQASKPDSSAVERGRYIVENVAMCGRCHTAWNQAGEAKHTNWLKGGPVQIRATYEIANWALVEPRLAGGPPGTDADFIRLLTTGISRTGAPPNPPMPNFRLNRADAEAVLAYLKSLK